jgi:hypothetical protein
MGSTGGAALHDPWIDVNRPQLVNRFTNLFLRIRLVRF